MKVFELLENDEWANNPETVEHLFRVQKTKVFEFGRKLLELINQFPELHRLAPYIGQPLSTLHSESPSAIKLSRWSAFLEHLKFIAGQKEIDKFHERYNRMLNAKKAYEKAGGTYDETI